MVGWVGGWMDGWMIPSGNIATFWLHLASALLRIQDGAECGKKDLIEI